MYNIGYIFYDDADYSNVAAYCTKNNLEIREIEPDEKGRRFQIFAFDTTEYDKQFEIGELKRWFDVFYSQHEQKYRRLIALGLLTDDNENPETLLLQLYQEAEVKRKRINELEGE